MHDFRFDTMAKMFAQRHRSRYRGAAVGESGVVADSSALSSTHDATPEPARPDTAHGPEMLFVQSFQSGTITATAVGGRFSVTLEHGLGQTIYFSDRPDRVVGASPTGQFLERLGFAASNPPNAALLVETAPGETDIAIVELFDPIYDEANHSATYEIAVLENWENAIELGFTKAPGNLAAIALSFGTAHLFIDGCANHDLVCHQLDRNHDLGTIPSSDFGGFCYSDSQHACMPCEPWPMSAFDSVVYWSSMCEERFADCDGRCRANGVF